VQLTTHFLLAGKLRVSRTIPFTPSLRLHGTNRHKFSFTLKYGYGLVLDACQWSSRVFGVPQLTDCYVDLEVTYCFGTRVNEGFTGCGNSGKHSQCRLSCKHILKASTIAAQEFRFRTLQCARDVIQCFRKVAMQL
jgi:hypothetical protein